MIAPTRLAILPPKSPMKTIFSETDYRDLSARLRQLPPDAPRQWGTMNSAQMLAHCAALVRVALGEEVVPRLFIGRIFGPFFRKGFLGPQPFPRNSPTAKQFVVVDQREFEKEKQQLLTLLERLHHAGETKVTRNPHAFFGQITPKQWGETQWKHVDHHLRQFGA